MKKPTPITLRLRLVLIGVATLAMSACATSDELPVDAAGTGGNGGSSAGTGGSGATGTGGSSSGVAGGGGDMTGTGGASTGAAGTTGTGGASTGSGGSSGTTGAAGSGGVTGTGGAGGVVGTAGRGGSGGATGTAGQGGTSAAGRGGSAGGGTAGGAAGRGGTTGAAGAGGVVGTAGRGGTTGTAGAGGMAGTMGQGGQGNLPAGVRSLFPPPNGQNLCPDPPLKITFNSAPTLGSSGRVRVFTSGGTAVATIDMAAATVSESIGGMTFMVSKPVYVDGNTVSVTLPPKSLAYGMTYYVNVDSGAITAGGAFSITDTTTWRFTTMAAAPSNRTAISVALDGSGSF